MTSSSELLLIILRISLTTAAMTIAVIGIAYLILGRSNRERQRMAVVIEYGSISAIDLVVCSILAFLVLCSGHENSQLALWITVSSFLLGCFLLLCILLVLAGFRRQVPLLRARTLGNDPWVRLEALL